MDAAQVAQAGAPPAWDGDAALLAQLAACEGVRAAPYRDQGGRLTVGIGWNLDANGVPAWAVLGLYAEGVRTAEHALDVVAPWWRDLDAVRRRALVNFAFNVGEGGLRGFPRFLACMEARDWAGARSELTSSKWWDQVGKRGPILAAMIMSGVDPSL